MKVLILTQFYLPEMGAPPARLGEWASSLSQRGHQIEVLTARPNYPHGKILDNAGRLSVVRQDIEGIHVTQCPLYVATGAGAKRLVSFASYVVSAVIVGLRSRSRPDVILVESPPLFLLFAARVLARRFGCRFVMNVSDLWPQSAIDMGVISPDGLVARLAQRLERSSYGAAAAVCGQSDAIVNEVRKRSTSPAHTITNGVDPTRFGNQQRSPHRAGTSADEVVFIYAGLFGLAQDLDLVVDLAHAVTQQRPHARFVLVGGGPTFDAISQRAARLGSDRIQVLPAVPRGEIPDLLARADVAVIPLVGSILGAVPSKIYEAMASHLAILLIAQGEAAERVTAANAGCCVAPGDLAAATTAALELIDHPERREAMGNAGRVAAETLYSRRRQVEALESVLATAAGHRNTYR